MGETGRLLGANGEITWQSAPLAVSRVTFKIEGLFEFWLERNLDQSLERARVNHARDPQTYQDRVRDRNAIAAAHSLAWTGAIAQKAAWEGPGFKELAYLCLVELNPTWNRDRHEQLFLDSAKVWELLSIIHQITAPDPNGQSPAPAQAAGQPS